MQEHMETMVTNTQMATEIEIVNHTLNQIKENAEQIKDNTNRKIDVIQAEMGNMVNNTHMATEIEAVKHTLDQIKENAEKLKENTRQANENTDKSDNQMHEQMKNVVSDIKELKDSDIIFLAKDITAQPTAGSIIKFSKVVENTDNVYDIATGCFTAPRRGTYWFSAQVCTNTGKMFALSIFVGEKLIVRGYAYYEDEWDCSTISAVTRLQVNDLVCLKAGPRSNSDALVTGNEGWKTDHFMGALIHE